MHSHEADKLPDGNFTGRMISKIRPKFPHLCFTNPDTDQITIADARNFQPFHDLKITVDKTEHVCYDHNRRAIRARDDVDFNKICKKLHSCVKGVLKGLYAGEAYKKFQRYSNKIASALLTLKGARRQPIHCDTGEREGLSALLAMNGSFKIIVMKGSVALVRRISQIRASWLKSGRLTPIGIDPDDKDEVEKWFDAACYAQLVREGWGSGDLKLEPYTILVPEGSALIFSTWLLHSGHEFTSEDLQVFNRVHMYLLPYDIGNDYETINLHRTFVRKFGLPLSPVLHFVPRPTDDELPEAVLLPCLFA